MAIYAVGDVQGCYDSLRRLVDHFGFDPDVDQLWLVGDLVNRGPRSVDVVRWVKSLGDAAVCVLGNHDLHLLAAALGLRELRGLDTLSDVIEAPDCDELIDWLRRRPFLHRADDAVMVHAGLHPSWTVERAAALAAELEEELAQDTWDEWLADVYLRPSQSWSDELEGGRRHRAIVSYLATVRTCTPAGDLCAKFYGPPAEAPRGCIPWFEVPGRASRDTTIVFGHWSRLGLRVEPHVIALDTGCVWGATLTAIRLEDRALFVQPACD